MRNKPAQILPIASGEPDPAIRIARRTLMQVDESSATIASLRAAIERHGKEQQKTNATIVDALDLFAERIERIEAHLGLTDDPPGAA